MAGFYPKLSILPLVAITPAADDGCMADTTAAVDARRRTPSWIALGAVCVVWGSIYLAIRVGVGHLRPRFLAGARHVIAGELYPIAVRAQTRSSGPGQGSAAAGAKAWLTCAVIGILLLFADHGCLTIGETTLPGHRRRAVATVPLWMIVFAGPVQHQRVPFRSAAAPPSHFTRSRNLHTRRNAGQVITTAVNALISAVRVNDQSQYL
jgi:hypothetical protein